MWKVENDLGLIVMQSVSPYTEIRCEFFNIIRVIDC